MFILVSRRNTTAIGREMLGLFLGTAISSLRCHPRPLHVPREIGVHAVERALLPNTRHRSSGLKIEGEHFKEQTGEQSSSPKTLGAAPRRCPRRPPENLIPMLDTETRRDSVHRMDSLYFSSPVHPSAAGARGARGPEFPRWEAGLSPCGAVGL